MKIIPKFDDAKFKRKLQQQIREQPKQVKRALGRTAEFLIGDIRKRTFSGKDARGANFKPYSKKPYFFNVGSENKPTYRTFDGGYAAFRAYKGRKTNKVDLNFTGKMMGNITQRANSKSAIIFFASKTQAEKALGNQEKNGREFFMIGNRDKTLIDFFAKELFKQNKLR